MSEGSDIDRRPPAASPPAAERAIAAMSAGRLAAARVILEQLLAAQPRDAIAKRLLAEVAARTGKLDEAERLLRQALEIDPSFADARVNLATVLQMQNRLADALDQLQRIDDSARERYGVGARRASVLGRLGRFDEAIVAYHQAFKRAPGDRQLALNLGHMLKAVGDRAGAIAHYRRALAISPGFGAAWWSLANLKTYRFDDSDIAAMQAIIADGEQAQDVLRAHFALGKAFEDEGDAAAAFAHYGEGNRLRSAQLFYRGDKIDAIIRSSRQMFTPAFFDARAPGGCGVEGPIFIVGMPRSGSTLVEQILGSHPLVEGLSELPYIADLAKQAEIAALEPGASDQTSAYPRSLEALSTEELRSMAAVYLERVAAHRRSGRPMFIDKMPNNWMHVGLIWLMLPNAKIIDVRRHPLACGFSNLKQHFAAGQEFAYDQEHFGHFYSSYLASMRLWEEIRPAAVHCVIYERLVAEPEIEIRRMLEYLGLEFDPACLNAHDNDRAVATPSAEQVRQPISAEFTEYWRRYEPWLGPLKAALGQALKNWSS